MIRFCCFTLLPPYSLEISVKGLYFILFYYTNIIEEIYKKIALRICPCQLSDTFIRYAL